MSLADSILQTASIARWVSVAVTATDQHHLSLRRCKPEQAGRAGDRGRRAFPGELPPRCVARLTLPRLGRGLGTEVRHSVHLANLALTLARPP